MMREPGLWVQCNLCGSTDLHILFTATRSARQVVRCRRCGLVFYNPQPSPEMVAGLYNTEYFEREFPKEHEEQQVQLAHRRLARIEYEVGGVGRLLDVGCGVGRFLTVARARGWTAIGLDGAPVAVQAATCESGCLVLQGDLMRSRPSDMPLFDVVTMWDVLEHLTDPVGDLRRVRHWLRPSGMLLIQTQNVNGTTYAWMRRRWEQFVEYHLFHFSSLTVQRALEQAGFEDIRIGASDRFVQAESVDPVKSPPDTRARRTLLDVLRGVRDRALEWSGYDSFNIMVVTARRGVRGPELNA